MMNRTAKPTTEDLRIEASNAKRELATQNGYVIELRGDIHASTLAIAALKKQLAEMESALKRRTSRLQDAEKKLAKMSKS